MELSIRSAISRAVVLLAALAIGGYLIFNAALRGFVGYATAQGSVESLTRAIALDRSDCDAYYRLGLYYSFIIAELDLKHANHYLREAVACQPLRGSYHLALAAFLESAGLADEADREARKACELEPHNTSVLWRAGNLMIRMGQIEAALNLFFRVLEGNSTYVHEVFTVCWKAMNDPELILDRVIPNLPQVNAQYLDFLSDPENLDYQTVTSEYLRILGHESRVPLGATLGESASAIESAGTPEELAAWNRAMRNAWSRRLDAADKVWDRMLGEKADFHAESSFAYIDALMRVRRSREAVSAWNQLVSAGVLPATEVSSSPNLVVNPSFEAAPLNGGLDWRIHSEPGVQIATDSQVRHSGASSLVINFQGLNNLDFHNVLQWIPVEPGTTYRFSAFLKSRGLTSTSGLRFEINDPRGAIFQTQDVLGTTPWSKYETFIHTGPETTAVLVGLRRTPAADLEKRIEGTLWVDDVMVIQEREGAFAAGATAF
jgi:tetratricopeptide (TPR) repeat protein